MRAYSEAIEQKYAALLHSRESQDWEQKGPNERRSFAKAERWALRAADSYFWSDDIVQAVKSSSDSLPSDTKISIPQIEGAGAVWWWFEKPLRIDGVRGDIAAILIFVAFPDGNVNEKRGVCITTYGTTDGVHFECKDTLNCDEFLSLERAEASVIAEVTDWEVTKTSDSVRLGSLRLMRFVIASLLWIDQVIVVASICQVERHAKKRLLLAGFQPSDVRVIMLRRKQYEPSGEHGDVEWSCQWIVRGHWRQQFYSSTRERKPLWILPHVKGPDDKPLKVPKQFIYVVNR